MRRLTPGQNSHAYQINDYINIVESSEPAKVKIGMPATVALRGKSSRLHISTDWSLMSERKESLRLHIYVFIYGRESFTL